MFGQSDIQYIWSYFNTEPGFPVKEGTLQADRGIRVTVNQWRLNNMKKRDKTENEGKKCKK